jgi:hypothetical protein
MRVFTAAIAIAFGVLVLAGYFLQEYFPVLAVIQTELLNWAIILAGVAALVGIFNLVSVHTNKVRRGEKGGVYSALLVISMGITIFFGLVLRPEHTAMKELAMNGIIIPTEAALMGILTISLLYAAIRLLRRRVDVMSILFLLTAVIILFGSATLPLPLGDVPIFGAFAHWVTRVGALGGMRGILIGVALGALTTGLRVLFGADRPYGGN